MSPISRLSTVFRGPLLQLHALQGGVLCIYSNASCVCLHCETTPLRVCVLPHRHTCSKVQSAGFCRSVGRHSGDTPSMVLHACRTIVIGLPRYCIRTILRTRCPASAQACALLLCRLHYFAGCIFCKHACMHASSVILPGRQSRCDKCAPSATDTSQPAPPLV